MMNSSLNQLAHATFISQNLYEETYTLFLLIIVVETGWTGLRNLIFVKWLADHYSCMHGELCERQVSHTI